MIPSWVRYAGTVTRNGAALLWAGMLSLSGLRPGGLPAENVPDIDREAAAPLPAQDRRSRTASRSAASSSGLKSGFPARWPQRESMGRYSAFGIRSVSAALSSGVK